MQKIKRKRVHQRQSAVSLKKQSQCRPSAGNLKLEILNPKQRRDYAKQTQIADLKPEALNNHFYILNYDTPRSLRNRRLKNKANSPAG